MKKLITIFAVMALLASCSKKSEVYETTTSGLQYLYREKSNSNIVPQEGNKLHLSVKYYNMDDSLLFNSNDISQRFIMDFFKPATQGSGINDAFAMMHEGDSMSFRINAYNFYLNAGQDNMLQKISKTDLLRFEIRLIKVLSPEIVQKEIEKKDEQRKDEEEFLLNNFISEKYPHVRPTKSGLYFIETKEGSGRTMTLNDSVAIHYTATYINGEPIYSTYQHNNPLIFKVSDPLVWPCLAEAVQYMRKGSKATIIAPSKLAAGEKGDSRTGIPPRKTIIFDIELVAYKAI